MRLIFEAYQDQQHYRSILVTHNFTERIRGKIFIGIIQQKQETKNWDLEERTQWSFLGEKRVWKSNWLQIIRWYELLAISNQRIQCRIRVDVVLTQFSPKKRSFLIATFNGINRAFSFVDTQVRIKSFFKIGSSSGILGLSAMRHEGGIQ